MQFQVVGDSWRTQRCLVALDTVLSGPLHVQQATILTKNDSEHLLVLWESVGWSNEGFIIPTGFASGYSGEGARGFSLALCMLYEHQVPMYHLNVGESSFDQIDGGYFPDPWQHQISERAEPCEMPIPGWTFVKHWDLAQYGRLWRVQSWRMLDTVIEWNESATVVDDFNWEIGDKLNRACRTLTRSSPIEDCQQVGLILRDAWIKFSRVIRKHLDEDDGRIGKNDVKRVLEAFNLPEALSLKTRKAYDLTNKLQHDTNAGQHKAKTCFHSSTEAMAAIIKVRFPGMHDPRKGSLIRPN